MARILHTRLESANLEIQSIRHLAMTAAKEIAIRVTIMTRIFEV